LSNDPRGEFLYAHIKLEKRPGLLFKHYTDENGEIKAVSLFVHEYTNEDPQVVPIINSVIAELEGTRLDYGDFLASREAE